jgi:ubiquinone/menaquinone biosynthesis C-methylase UbiE
MKFCDTVERKMWNAGWDVLFTKNEWGKYPPEELVRFMARQFGQNPDRSCVKVLEVGCGPGANLWYLARVGYAAYGLDGSQTALDRAQSRLEAMGLTATLTQGDAMKLPYEDEFFDCVLDIECVYANNLEDSKRILQEAWRVLKKDGSLFSKTFATGTYGDGNGTLLVGEPHTYVSIREGALQSDYGIIRFTAKDEIAPLYGMFKSIQYDYLVRSDKNRKYEVREWLISCRK